MIKQKSRTRGQIAVVAALILTALLLFTALVVDGSNAYQQRRICQNAADAGALAGIRTMAVEPGRMVTNREVFTSIVNFAQQNIGTIDAFSAEYVNQNNERMQTILSYGDSSAPPAEAVGVYVYVQNRYNLFLGRLAGQAQKVSSATATSRMGSLGVLSGGAFPVGVPQSLLTNVRNGQLLRIWDDNKVTDTTDTVIVGGNRGWLNFNFVYNSNDLSRVVSTQQSNSDLQEWVRNGYGSPLFAGTTGQIDGDFIDGDSGTRSSTIDEASMRIGQTVFVPIYDVIYSGVDLNDDRRFPVQPNPDFLRPGNYFHIVGFAAFNITATQRSGSNKYLEGAFQFLVQGGRIGGGLSRGTPGGIQAISLFNDATVARGQTGPFSGNS